MCHAQAEGAKGFLAKSFVTRGILKHFVDRHVKYVVTLGDSCAATEHPLVSIDIALDHPGIVEIALNMLPAVLRLDLVN